MDKSTHTGPMKIRNIKDFAAGILFISFGGFVLIVARSYKMGTAVQMGPGYFPILLGSLLVFLGLITVVRGLWTDGEAIGSIAPRPLLLIIGSVIAFAFLIQPLGLVLTILALVFISSLGNFEFKLLDTFILFLVLGVVTVVIFVYGLRLPFNLFWER